MRKLGRGLVTASIGFQHYFELVLGSVVPQEEEDPCWQMVVQFVPGSLAMEEWYATTEWWDHHIVYY